MGKVSGWVPATIDAASLMATPGCPSRCRRTASGSIDSVGGIVVLPTMLASKVVRQSASTPIPAAKILKITRLIQPLGGVSQAVQIFWGVSFNYRKLKVLGGATGALAAELFGVGSIQQKGFS